MSSSRRPFVLGLILLALFTGLFIAIERSEAVIVTNAERDLAVDAPDAWLYGRDAWDAEIGSGTVDSGNIVIGDFNGDGINDLVKAFIGGDGPANGRSGCGDVILLYGPLNLSGSFDLSTFSGDSAIFYGRDANDFMSSLSMGDLDGDGKSDLAMGFAEGDGPANGRGECGDVVVVYGATNVKGEFDLRSYAGDSAIFYGRDAGDNVTFLSMGDINGDGKADLAMGFSSGDGPANGRSACGDVVVVYGATNIKGEFDLQSYSGDSATFYGRDVIDYVSSLSMGDLNGDGKSDLAMGFVEGDGPANGRTKCGDVIVVYGATNVKGEFDLQSYSGDSAIFYGRDDMDELSSLAMGDINGDGKSDLAMGFVAGDGPANGRGQCGDVVIVYGAANLIGEFDLRSYAGDSAIFYGRDDGDILSSLAMGDLNGDGKSDLAMGFFYGDGPANGRSACGDVAIVYGTTNVKGEFDLRSYAGDSAIFYGRDAGDVNSGVAVGDLNGDSIADLVIAGRGGDGPANGRAECGDIAIIYSNRAPTGVASASPASGQAPLTVSFSGTGTDPNDVIAKYEWDLNGDGVYDFSSASNGSTSYTYGAAGTYRAVLRVTDSFGASDTKAVTVTVSAPPNPPSATATPATVTAPVSTTANLVKYQWDFNNDGAWDYSSATDSSARRLYGVPGESHTAVFRILYKDGTEARASVAVNVVNPGGAWPLSVGTASPSLVKRNQGVLFTATWNQNGYGSGLGRIEWDFDGDGVFDWVATTNNATLTYIFKEAGTYTAVQRVIAANGAEARNQVTVTVQNPSGVSADITEPDSGATCAGTVQRIRLQAQNGAGEQITRVVVQYAPNGGAYDTIATLTSAPWQTDWDISALADGTYHLRTVVIGSAASTATSETVTVRKGAAFTKKQEIVSVKAQTVLQTTETLADTQTNIAGTGDGTEIEIGMSILGSNDTIVILEAPADSYGATSDDRTIHALREFTLGSGKSSFNRDIILRIPYSDTNNDGYVDGTTQAETDLVPYYWSGDSWVRHTDYVVLTGDNIVEIRTPHLSGWGLGGGASSSSGASGLNGSACLLTNAFGARAWLAPLRGLRDGMLGSSLGRLAASVYYEGLVGLFAVAAGAAAFGGGWRRRRRREG